MTEFAVFLAVSTGIALQFGRIRKPYLQGSVYFHRRSPQGRRAVDNARALGSGGALR